MNYLINEIVERLQRVLSLQQVLKNHFGLLEIQQLFEYDMKLLLEEILLQLFGIYLIKL
jgi:hypothetical protein